MDTRLLAVLFLLAGLMFPGIASAQSHLPMADWANPNWWRGTATLDMDFLNDRYYLNGTTYSGATYGTNINNFITGAGATFTRAGTNVTANSSPFYLSSIQSFVSRASVTNNVTSTFAPFYIGTSGSGPSQSWVSRADGGNAIATYFDNTGTLQTAAAGTARSSAYYYSGSSWVSGGTLIEPATTNYNRNNTMAGAVVADGVERSTNGTFSSCSGSTCSGWTTSLNGGTGTVSFGSNAVTLTGDGTHAAVIYQNITTVVGLNYTVTLTVPANQTMYLYARDSSNNYLYSYGGYVTQGTTTAYEFTATTTTTQIAFGVTGTSAVTVSGVSAQSVGALPNNWLLNSPVTGIAYQVAATGTENGINYVDIRFVGTASNGGGVFRMLTELDGNIPATIGQTCWYSMYMKTVAAPVIPSGYTVSIQLRGLSAYSGTASPTYSSDGLGNNYNGSSTGITVAAGSSNLNANRIISGGTVADPTTKWLEPRPLLFFTQAVAYDFTIRFGMPQVEVSNTVLVPTSVIATSGSTVTRAADVYNQQPASYFANTGTLQFAAANTARTTYSPASPYSLLGTLIEPAATNSISNNMMVGAVAADGIERTINGTFSTTSPNVCSGSDTSSGNSLSCSNGTAVTAQSIKTITYSSTTATVTTNSAHGLSVGNIVTISGASPSNYNGAYMVVSVPSTTTFTYTMITAPSSNATTVGSYTATVGGWAGTVNGGTGTVTGASGSMTLTGDGTNAASVYEAIPTISGYYYYIAVTAASGNPLTIQAGTSVGGSSLLSTASVAAGTTSYFEFMAYGTTSYVQINNASSSSGSVTTVSVQSAGAPPTGWTIDHGSTSLVHKIVGTGTENGVAYVDIQFSGTSSVHDFCRIHPVGTTSITASNGQSWSGAFFSKLASGSFTNISNFIFQISEYGTSGFLQYDTISASLPNGNALNTQRQSETITLSNSSTTSYQTYYQMNCGSTVNFTMRIGMPQLEQSSYATSTIPTFGSAVTRTADVYNQPVGEYFNSSGVLTTAANNTPRLDHSPTSPYAANGILIEESRTNLVTYSSQYSSGWSDNGYGAETINHNVTAPDGGLSYSIAATANYQGWWYYFMPTASTTYAYSVFVKNVSGGSSISIGPAGSCWGSGNNVASVTFNDVTGAFSGIGAGVTSYSAQQLANGWWRVNIVATAGSPSCSGGAALLNYPLSGSTASENAFWGNQMEAGSFPTSYIPTSGTTITRQADVFTVPTTAAGANGAWYTANVGTLFGSGVRNELNSFPAVTSLDDGTLANAIENYLNSAGVKYAEIETGSSQVYSSNAGSNYYTIGNVFKGVLAFQANNVNSAEDGVLDTLSTSVAMPAVTELRVGALRGGAYYWDGWLNRIWYMPTRQPDSSLTGYTQ